MLEGITVLNTYDYCISYSWDWTFFGTLALVFSAICLIVGIIGIFTLDDNGSSFFLLFLLLLLVGVLINKIGNKNYVPVYEVTIDDSVSMLDFEEKYEIVKQEGKIYHIIERTENTE